MKKGIIIIVAVIVVILSLGGFYAYLKGQQNRNITSIVAVPVNAAAIIDIKDTKAITTKLLQGNSVYADIATMCDSAGFISFISVFDSLLRDADFYENLKLEKPILSFHDNTGVNKYNLLVSCAFAANNQGKKVEEYICNYLQKKGSVAETKYNQARVFTFSKTAGSKAQLLFTFYKGFFLLSTHDLLLQDAIRQTESTYNLTMSPEFQQVMRWGGKHVDVNVYLQLKYFNQFIQKQFTNGLFSDMAIQTFADWACFDISIKKDTWLVNGFTLDGSTNAQWAQLFDGQETVSTELTKKIPLGVSRFSWYGLSNLNRYFTNLANYMDNMGQRKRFDTNRDQVVNHYGDNLFSLVEQNFGGAMVLFTMADGANVFVLSTKGRFEAKQIVDALTEQQPDAPQVFTIDKDTKFNIHKMTLTKLPVRMFGPWFGKCVARYVTTVDNMVVFADTYSAASRFIYDNVLQKSLCFDPDYVRFENYMTSRANFYQFVSLTNSEHQMDSVLSKSNADFYKRNLDKISKLYGLAWQFSAENGLFYHNSILRHQPATSSLATTLWETHLDTLAAFKPALMTNHNTGEKEIFVQDLQNNIYLINSAGRIIWKKRIAAPIIGTVHQVDFYKNGKLQYLFNTGNQIYLIDRNGNNVDHYPIELPSPTKLPLALFDYSNSRDYRIFITCINRSVLLYNISGRTIPDFTFKDANQTPISPVQHFVDNGKDYIAITDSSRIYLLDRKGNMRLEYKEHVWPSVNNQLKYLPAIGNQQSALVRTTNSGEICFLHFDGTIERKNVGKFGTNHYFDLEDICGDRRPEMIFADSNKVQVFTLEGKEIFSRTFDEPVLQPAFYRLTDKQVAIGITEANSASISLIDEKGKTLKGFPLIGKTRFSIGMLQKNQAYYNLVVGGNDQYLFNYKINK